MKTINLKTLTLMLSASIVLAFTGCDSKVGDPSDSQLVGQVPVEEVGQAPVAVAGADRTIVEGDSFTLDGKESYDSDGEIISYVWSGAGLSKEGITVYFDSVPYRVEPYIITLTVTDNDGNTNSDTVEITVIAADADNLPPEAKASISPKENYNCSDDADWGMNIVLDASLSSDPEGEALSFAWSGTLGDDKESIKELISNKDNAIASMLVKDACNQCGKPTPEDPYEPKTCGLIFNVNVTDIGALSDNAQVTGSVMWEHNLPPAPPVADAGPDQTIGICDALIMDGTGSSDTDGSIVKYVWTVGDGAIVLGEGPTPTLTLAGRTPGEHNITLTVTDNNGDTDSDIVTVTVTGADEDYDFSYIIKNPVGETAHVTSNPGAQTATEGTYSYWKPTTAGSSGYVNLQFDFPATVEIAYLYARVDTFNWYGNTGHAWLRGSSDGTDWDELAEAVPPAESSDWIGARYNDFVPDTMLGTSSILVQAELLSLGWTNLAQFLRWDTGHPDSTTFKLNVCYEGEPEAPVSD